MLKNYLKKILEIANRGDAREESYYSTLEALLKEYSQSINRKNIAITTLPKKTEAGNPDFRIWDGSQHIVGYIEAKQPIIETLDQIESTEQLKRYRHTFPNLMLTNFFEFRLFRNGQLTDRVQIAKPYIINQMKKLPPVENETEFLNLLDKYFSFSLPKVYNAKTLAVELAKRTKFLNDIVIEELSEEEKAGKGFILGFYQAFSEYLIANLSKEDFSNLYSQTITYGLFAARTRAKNGFSRKLAYDSIPKTIGILRDVFKFISLEDLPKQMEVIIDDISEVLAVTDVYKILDDYFHQHKGKDPIVHFYETFLAEYDPEAREKRGVYYTPEPVVSYITRSLNIILKEHFDKVDGLGDSSVTVLDPAAGTLTFLAEAAKLVVEEGAEKYGEGIIEPLIREHILKNFFAFEIMMAPYAVGHLKMSFLLEELGYKLKDDDRFKLYLTNTLEMEELEETQFPGMASLSEESHLAGKVKKEQPILVVLGNPPYSGHSSNVGEWIRAEIKQYFQVDGRPLGEKNPKWLQDDYVKFIRFAQWKIDQAGGGVIGLITNHSYIDNPTFRGMRQSLMNSFNEIYLLDLHGNSLKKEKCPDGSKDENVFDIRQGVAIALFVKRKRPEPEIYEPPPQVSLFYKEPPKPKPYKHKCNVYHAEIWGLRKQKYEWLLKKSLKTTKWKKLNPKSEFYLFIPRDEKLLDKYQAFPKITDIFPVNSVGIVTARDDLTIKWTSNEVWNTVLNFSRFDVETARQAYGLGKDARDWKVEFAQKDLKESSLVKKKIAPILYRPFDTRYTYYTGKSRGFHCMPRHEIMRHMFKDNLGLLTCRQQSISGFYHAFVSSTIVESCVVSNKTTEINYLFPLYLYKEKEKPKKNPAGGVVMALFEPEADYGTRKPNINPKILEELDSHFHGNDKKGMCHSALDAESIFYYIYAVLYSNIYRTKYVEFLKIDFPRVPFTSDYKLFNQLSELGEKLVDLHLLKSPELDNAIVKFQGASSNKVEKVTYNQDRVYINSNQYFEGIESEVWQYQIGGYQVLNKWLKDRKGRELSLEDVQHYCKIAATLQKTIQIQTEIDQLYPKIEENLLSI